MAQEDDRVRVALAARAALRIAACAAWTGAALAASDPLEVIVVTGSRIGRADVAGPTPVVSIPARVFEQTGAISLERTLDLYPQVLATAGSTSNSPSNDGQANVSLRGLGPNRTLVLLDGRRLMPADGNGAVDLNTIPPALVESVELMTGGASAAYGSDAIAGVVNVRLRERFDGLALEASTAATERGDGATHSAGITAGKSFGDGAGSVMAYAGYASRDGVRQDERAFSRYPLQYVAGLSNGLGPGGSFIGSGSSITQDGINIVFADLAAFNSVFAGYGYAPDTVPQQAGISVNADGTLFTTGNGAPGSVVNYRGDRENVLFNDRTFAVYNFAPDTALQMPLERTSGFLRGSYAFDDALELHAQVLYADYSVERQLAPAPAGIVLIPPTNPFIPPDLRTLLDSRSNPSAPYRYFRRMSEVGAQAADNDRSVLQWTIGARGKLGADWAYDVYAQYGANDRSEQQTNSVSLSRMQDLTFAADGGASICEGGFDPFRAATLSSECARYVALAAENDVRVLQSIAEAAVNGPAWALPGGALRLALGLLYKKDEFDYRADSALSALQPGMPGVIGPRPDVSGFAAAPNRSGDEHNVDAYVEALLPLLGGRRGVESLELGLGYRYSDHSRAGDVDSYKAELSYRPVSRLQLRSSLQHAVRAPSIEELYYPAVPNQFVIPIPDPCDANKSLVRNGPDRVAVEALCLEQGVPAALLPGFDFELRRVDGVSGGNPELQPEEADTVTLGFVYTWPSSMDRGQDLRVSLDGYHIEIERGIGRWDAESAVARCFNRQYNPTFDNANVYCTFFSRDSITGNIFADIRDRNIGGIETAGVDVQLDWGVGAGPGQLTIGALGSYVDYWRYLDPSGGRIEYARTVGGGGLGRTLPEWKSLLNLGYAWNGLALDARWRHLGSASDVNVRNFTVPAYDYVDLGARYAPEDGALQGASVWFGVDNVFDEDPPIFPTWQQANTDPSVYDVLGRSYYLRLRYAFR